jgi:hypothetical protein
LPADGFCHSDAENFSFPRHKTGKYEPDCGSLGFAFDKHEKSENVFLGQKCAKLTVTPWPMKAINMKACHCGTVLLLGDYK